MHNVLQNNSHMTRLVEVMWPPGRGPLCLQATPDQPGWVAWARVSDVARPQNTQWTQDASLMMRPWDILANGGSQMDLWIRVKQTTFPARVPQIIK